MEVFDDCCGHPDPMGRYHYHIYPKCIHTSFKDEAGQALGADRLRLRRLRRSTAPTARTASRRPIWTSATGTPTPILGYHYHVTRQVPVHPRRLSRRGGSEQHRPPRPARRSRPGTGRQTPRGPGFDGPPPGGPRPPPEGDRRARDERSRLIKSRHAKGSDAPGSSNESNASGDDHGASTRIRIRLECRFSSFSAMVLEPVLHGICSTGAKKGRTVEGKYRAAWRRRKRGLFRSCA